MVQIKLIKQTVENFAGPQAVKIVDIIYNKRDVNEFIIAKKLGLTINQTRNLLYKLSSLGIISSIRKKDRRKGWYIYFWTLNVLKSLELLKEKISNEIKDFEKELAIKKSERFYKCNICGVEVNEEIALLNNFICNECGEVYSLSDNKQHLISVSEKIEKLRKELNIINKELIVEKEDEDKQLKKQNKKTKQKKSLKKICKITNFKKRKLKKKKK